jgi:hypothetical protein
LSSASALQGATGTGRDLRRVKRGGRGDWVRSYTRVQRAITASMRLIDSTLRAARASERCAHRRPISSSQKLGHASGQLVTASVRLARAAASLAEAHECLARDPGREPGAPGFLIEATSRLLHVGRWLSETADHVFTLHEDVLHGLATGELVPEQPAQRRRRIVLIPRPAPVRAFLRARLPRVVDRISAILQRRRRTRLPASLRVPRRTSQGRAPPLFPVCLV